MPRLAAARALDSVVREIAREITMPFYLKAVRSHKADGSTLTEADELTQHALVERLPEIQEAPVLGEEMTAAQQAELWHASREGLWVIDPIDGTTNFANGIPIFGLSVAYVVEGATQFGVVYNPVADESFYAARGAGAWLNGIRLPLRRSAATLSDSVGGVDFKRIPARLATRLANESPCYSLRNFGSSALEWCYVAAGRLDVYLHGGQMLWDYAVGRLLVEESGGQATDPQGLPIAPDPRVKQAVAVAASPALHKEWLSWLERSADEP
ncbi:MAG: inositol monophosphatase [Betaproteobacteria bacterium]|nr:inositol monophosphatase [Betaproteobacteria bacterium]